MVTNMENIIEGNRQTVAELAISHPAALAVFTKYNIDYCCGGHRSLEEASRRVGLDPEQIKNEIYNSPAADTSGALRPENWSSH
jgi:regulator of cell morphogenesis and NO signaling